MIAKDSDQKTPLKSPSKSPEQCKRRREEREANKICKTRTTTRIHRCSSIQTTSGEIAYIDLLQSRRVIRLMRPVIPLFNCPDAVKWNSTLESSGTAKGDEQPGDEKRDRRKLSFTRWNLLTRARSQWISSSIQRASMSLDIFVDSSPFTDRGQIFFFSNVDLVYYGLSIDTLAD